MRSLTDTQLSAQKARSCDPICKLVLTYGATTYTYDFRKIATAATRILKSTHTERQWSQVAQVVLNDADLTLVGVDLEGFKGVMSYGFTTSAGDEWSATAPLWVVGQQRDSMQGKVLCSLSLEGTFDRMARDKASASYSQEATDTQTVKTLLTAIAGATLAPYSHCKAFTVTYDSEDSLIDSFTPADFFRIGLNESRLSVFQRLLAYTGCKARVEDDGEIHVFVPTTTGVVYAYEYRLEDTYHTFLSKRFRRRVVSPNYIVVQSHPDQTPSYSGYAEDSSANLTDMEEREYHYVRATSDAQCTSLATAILSRYQLEAEKGAGILPIMNIGAEVYDYSSINDTRAGDNAVGNLGWITRNVGRSKFGMDFGFGKISAIPLETQAALASGGEISLSDIKSALQDLHDNQKDIAEILSLPHIPTINVVNKALLDLYEDATFKKLTAVEQMIIPVSPTGS